MDINFLDFDLDRLETDLGFNCNGKFSTAIIRAYRMRIQAIRAARDGARSLRLQVLEIGEKLDGNRSHQRSIRLNDQWRLIVEIQKGNPLNTMVIVAIEDYH